MIYKMPKTVSEAAKILDDHFDSESWVEKIEKSINLDDTEHCIIGQVFGNYFLGMKALFGHYDMNLKAGHIFCNNEHRDDWVIEIANRGKIVNDNFESVIVSQSKAVVNRSGKNVSVLVTEFLPNDIFVCYFD